MHLDPRAIVHPCSQVYLGPGNDGHPYLTQSIQQGSAVSRDLIFDGTSEYLYVMTQSTVSVRHELGHGFWEGPGHG